MIASTAELMGIDSIGIGSDLVQGHGNEVVEWMRNGRWNKEMDFGEGSANNAGWPEPVEWFSGNRDFANIAIGLGKVGFDQADIKKIMGENWLNFFERAFGPK